MLSATAAAKTIAVQGSAAPDWPTSCDTVHWPPAISKPAANPVYVAAGFMEAVGFKGIGNIVQSGETLVNVWSDSEMAVPDTTKQAYIYKALGREQHLTSPMAAYRFGDFALAQSKARQVSDQAKVQYGPTSAQYASSLTLLAIVHTDAGYAQQNDKAEAYWKEAIDIFRATRSTSAEGMALIGYGYLIARQGRIILLEQIVDRLLSLRGLSVDQQMLALALAARLDMLQGHNTSALRKLATALQHWDQRLSASQAGASDIARNLFGAFQEEDMFELVPQLEGAQVLVQAAELVSSNGFNEAGIKLLETAIAKTRQSAAHYRPERVDHFIQLAELRSRSGKRDEAASAIKTVSNIQRWNLVQFNRAVADRSYVQGLLGEQAGDFAEAELRLRYALGWWQTDLGASPKALRPVTLLSRLYGENGHPQLSEQYAKVSVCFADKLRAAGIYAYDSSGGEAVRDAYISYLESVFRMAQSGHPHALATAMRSAQAATDGRAAHGIEMALRRHAPVDRQMAAMLTRREQLNTDLERARRMRASQFINQTGLLEDIKAIAQRDAPSDAPSKSIWLSRVGELGHLDTVPILAQGSSSEQISAQLAKLNAEISSRAGGRALHASKDVTLDQLRQALGTDEALVQYVVADKRTFVIAIDKTSGQLAEVSAGRAGIASAVASVRASLKGPVPSTFDGQAAADLHRLLLQPVAGIIGNKRRLILIKDGPLGQVPFGLFKEGSASGPWLIEKYALINAPSAAAFVVSRKRIQPSRAARPFLGIGDPVLGKAAAPSNNVAEILGLRGASRGLSDLNELPETAAELQVTAKAFGAGDGSLLLRDAATEKRVRTARLSDYRTISFATHALMPGETLDNDEAAIVLSSPSAEAHGAEDGLLTSSEIAMLKLDADLVVLSACNTAAGNDALGSERLGGLARSFFVAGARSLLVTNWSVDSRATQDLMTRFAANLRGNSGKAEALQTAMRQLATGENQAYRHPYYWAAFDLIGS